MWKKTLGNTVVLLRTVYLKFLWGTKSATSMDGIHCENPLLEPIKSVNNIMSQMLLFKSNLYWTWSFFEESLFEYSVDVGMEVQCFWFTASEGEDVHLEVMVQLRAEAHILSQLL